MIGNTLQGSGLGTFAGLKVYLNDLLIRDEPVRKHKDRGEVRRNRLFKGFIAKPSGYHKRVQKKWLKRYGTKRVPFYIIHGQSNSVFMHPEFHRMLIAHLANEEKLLLEGSGLFGKGSGKVICDDL